MAYTLYAMAMTATTVVRRYGRPVTPADCIITGNADSAITYGTTLVTTARLTRTPNCSLREGEIVESASSDCAMAMTIIPAIGASRRLTQEKSAGNIRWSAADFAVCAIVNCQPRSEPTHAITASAITTEPITGLNMRAYASAKGPVDFARSAFGTIPWITVVDRM